MPGSKLRHYCAATRCLCKIWTRRNPPPPTSPQCENARSPQSPLTTPHAIRTVLACVRVATPAMMQGLAEACQGRTSKTSPRAPWARPARLIQDTSATLTRKLHDCVFFINIGAPTRCLPSKRNVTAEQNQKATYSQDSPLPRSEHVCMLSQLFCEYCGAKASEPRPLELARTTCISTTELAIMPSPTGVCTFAASLPLSCAFT